MRKGKSYFSVGSLIIVLMMVSACGVPGDPGHCYMSVDWEYYADDYRVNFYEDNNVDIPDWEEIETEIYYDCYPGDYEYSYEAEDELYWYSYTGVYSLIQNPGYAGGFLHDGLDGADTYFDLFLAIYAKKGLKADSAVIAEEFIEWEMSKGKWIISIKEKQKKTLKLL